LSDPAYEREIEAVVANDHRISTSFSFLSDAELVSEVTQGELVVLPYPEMHNSGAALAALSLGRPILVPDNEVNRLLADEVGPGWVCSYTGELTGQHITDALADVRTSASTAMPDMSARRWADAGRLHARAYHRAVGLRRGMGKHASGSTHANP
jgi:hypothetical protein